MIDLRKFDVEQILKKILTNQMSREEASEWAFNLRQEGDNKNLAYKPSEYESMLWESIIFIEGIDLQIEPNVYLHNSEDIVKFLQDIENIGR